MVVVATIMNYYVLIPLYIDFCRQFGMTAEQSMQSIVEAGTQNNQAIIDLRTLVMYGIVPFNILR